MCVFLDCERKRPEMNTQGYRHFCECKKLFCLCLDSMKVSRRHGMKELQQKYESIRWKRERENFLLKEIHSVSLGKEKQRIRESQCYLYSSSDMMILSRSCWFRFKKANGRYFLLLRMKTRESWEITTTSTKWEQRRTKVFCEVQSFSNESNTRIKFLSDSQSREGEGDEWTRNETVSNLRIFPLNFETDKDCFFYPQEEGEINI